MQAAGMYVLPLVAAELLFRVFFSRVWLQVILFSHTARYDFNFHEHRHIFSRGTPPNNSINRFFIGSTTCFLHWWFSAKYFMQKEVLWTYLKMNPSSRDTPVAAFLGLDMFEIRGWRIVCCGSYTMQQEMLSSITGFYPPDTSRDSLEVTARRVYRHCQVSPGGDVHSHS